jgi:hypothetical protein
MKLLYIIIVVLTFAFTTSNSQWNMVYKHYPDNRGLQQPDLDCADSLNCISVSSPGATGSMYIKTTDGGYNWDVALVDTFIYIYDEQGQWIDVEWPKYKAARCIDYVTQDFIVVGHQEGQITISRDGGVTWDSTNLNTRDLKKIKFIDENYGVAFGGYKTLFKTYNGGQDWEKIDLDYYDENQEINGTSEVYFELIGKDSLIVFIYHYRDTTNIHYTSFSTIDGGITWEAGGVIPYWAGEPSFLNMNEGWLAGRFKTDASKYNDIIFHTTNGGKTWETQLDTFIAPQYGLNGIYFLNRKEGIAWGDGRKIWRTYNGGKSWNQEAVIIEDINDSFQHMVFPNKTFTKRIATTYFTGTIWLYEDLTSVNEDEINIGNFNIFPNPTRDFITIQTSEVLKTSEVSKVLIFDMLGLEVMSESIHPMTGSHRMNVEKLPAGVYFIRVGDKVEKFVKM